MKFRAMLTGLMAAIGLSDDQLAKAKQVIETVPDVEVGGEEKKDEEPTKKTEGGDDKRENAELRAQLAKQSEMLEALSKRFADQDATIEAKTKADKEAAITAAIDKAKADGRIPAQNTAEVERWTKLLQADPTNAQALLDAMPKAPGKAGDSSDNKQSQNGTPSSAKPHTAIGAGVRSDIMKHVNEGLAAAQN